MALLFFWWNYDTLVLMMLLFSSLLDYSWGAQVYYVTNSESIIQTTSCTFENEEHYPCFTLEKLANKFTPTSPNAQSKIIIYFLLENCYTIKNISFHFSDLSDVHLKPWKNRTNIHCIGDLALNYFDVSTIIIESIIFQDCGKFQPVITVLNIDNEPAFITINNTEFLESRHGFVKIQTTIASLNVSNCLFDGNKADYGVDIDSVFLHSIFNKTTFSNNVGSLQIYSVCRSKFLNCLFDNNTSARESAGGAIRLYTITENDEVLALLDDLQTLADDLLTHSVVEVSGCTFINNTASNGGAIAVKHAFLYIEFIDTIFIGNRVPEQGGALRVQYANNNNIYDNCAMIHKINNCTFQDNYAPYGGSIYVQSANYTPTDGVATTCIAHFIIQQSIFTNNHAETNGGALEIHNYWHIFSQDYSVSNAELTINSLINICHMNITSSVFLNNSGTRGGALRLEGINAINITNCTFSNEKQLKVDLKRKGGAVLVRNVEHVTIQDCSFYSNHASYGGVLHAYSSDTGCLNISNTSFINNTATDYGGALYVHGYKSNFNKISFRANKAGKSGGAIFTKHKQSILKHCTFLENQAEAGGAIYCKHADMIIENLSMQTNIAVRRGGGIALYKSKLNINQAACFINNKVKLGNGGAISIKDRDEDCFVNSCLLTWNNESRITFLNNSANKGSILYGGMIDRCYKVNSNIFPMAAVTLTNTSELNYANSVAVASDTIRFCFYNNYTLNCDIREINRTIHLGQIFGVHVVCLDQVRHAVQCIVRSEYLETATMNLGEGENPRIITGHGILRFHAFSELAKHGTLVMTATMLCVEEKWTTLKVHVKIQKCPHGFEQISDRCQCDHRLKMIIPHITCNISSNSMTSKVSGWFSYQGNYLRVHKDCPLNYCFLNENIHIQPSYPDTQCNNNRSGILCGGCATNFSVVLGSWKCMKCSNMSRYNFIWLTVLITLAGVILIVFLLLVKMTVSTGTTNGLIFYANIISFSGLLDYQACSIHPILRVFLSWINLDLGIEVCFYSGMDVYQKMWLQFAFSFYIWFLVGAIILFCQYSSRVMKLMGLRNIEILATLFLLSYAKFLKTIFSALSFTNIMVASVHNVSDQLISKKVWVYNGNISFLGQKHVPLFGVAMLFLILLFMPYTIFLTFGQCLRCLPKRKGLNWIHTMVVTSILDAYHAPYTDMHRYWTGFGLLIRCCLFIIFGTSYNIYKNLFWTSLAVVLIFTIRQCFSSVVYKTKISNLLELFHLANLGGLAAAIQYSHSCYPLTISATLSLLLFVCTLIYHVNLVIPSSSSCHWLQEKIQSLFFCKKIKTTDGAKEITIKDNVPVCPSTTFIELREPLIEVK